jgi:hypothetical protein
MIANPAGAALGYLDTPSSARAAAFDKPGAPVQVECAEQVAETAPETPCQTGYQSRFERMRAP